MPPNSDTLPELVIVDEGDPAGARRIRRLAAEGRLRRLHAGESLWSIARRHHINVNTLASMNGMHPGDSLHAGQKIKLATTVPRSSAPQSRRVTYIVRAGDTLRQIAKLFQVSVSQILSWNGMSSESHILKGMKLTIRVASRGG